MKKIYCSLAATIFLVTIGIYAQTNVSGHITANTTWLATNSPYIVTDSLIVDDNITLTIEPKVVVQIDTGKFIRVNGTLIAKGTASDSIYFKPHLSGNNFNWGYLEFTDGSADALVIDTNYVSGCILEYCNIGFAGISNYNIENKAAVILRNAHPFINHCSISNNFSTGIIGLNLTDTLHISNSIISYNNSNNYPNYNAGGVYLLGGAKILIYNNKIFNNTSSASDYLDNAGGIYATSYSYCNIYNNSIYNNHSAASLNQSAGGALTASNNTYVTNNYFYGNSSELGIGGFRSMAIAFVTNNLFYNNFSNSGIGGVSVNYDSQLERNVIVSNTSNSDAGGVGVVYGSYIHQNVIAENKNLTATGGAIHWWGCCGAYSISNNQIVNNTAKDASAIYFDGGMQSLYNNTVTQNTNTDSSGNPNYTLLIKNNYVLNNNNFFNNAASFELYNYETGSSTMAGVESNWWGTTTDSIIMGKIYNWTDTSSLGVIDYTPFLLEIDTIAPISTPYNVQKVNLGSGQIKLAWNKNPEADLAGYKVYYGNFNGYSFSNMTDAGTDTSIILSNTSVSDTFAVTAYDNGYNTLNNFDSTIVNDNMVYGNESWFAFAKPNCFGLALSLSATSASCSSCNDGIAIANAIGGTAPYTYEWNTNPTQTTSNISGLTPGTYSVTASDFNGCMIGDSIVISFSTGLNSNGTKFNYSIFPNPAKHHITINQNSESNLVIKIYNALGSIVYHEIVKQKEFNINFSDFNQGVYIIEINNGTFIEKQKIYIQH